MQRYRFTCKYCDEVSLISWVDVSDIYGDQLPSYNRFSAACPFCHHFGTVSKEDVVND